MNDVYVDIVNEAKKKVCEVDFSDIVPKGSNYFSCGYKPLRDGCYYNYNIAIAFVIIGKLYKDKNSRNSNYHQGVAYIAKKAGISKSKVKALRKMFSYHEGYIFKTPFEISEILQIMIDLLEAKISDPLVIEYLKTKINEMYREILISRQFDAIQSAASTGLNENIKRVYNKLNCITKKVGR